MALDLIIQKLLLIEILMNLSSAIPMLLTPADILARISSTAPMNLVQDPTPSQLMQWIGGFICTLTIPMFLVLPNGKDKGVQRRLVYELLLSGEALLTPVFIWQALAASSAVERVVGAGGVTSTTLWMAAGMVAPLGVLRSYVLVAKGHWFVDGVESRDAKGKRE